MKLSAKLEHELRVLQRAARNPQLKAALAAYDALRRRGVPHLEAIRLAAEFVGLSFDDDD